MPHYDITGRPQSGFGDGQGHFPPAEGTYLRLAPSADAVQDIGAEALQPGDLILSTTSDSVSAAIRAYTDSPVSHISVYLGNGEVIEAIGQGVTVHPLSAALSDDYYAAAYRVNGLTEEDRSRLVAWLRTQRGRPYDVGGLLSDFTDDPEAYFCSELVTAAFNHIGKPLYATEPRDSQPGHILTLSNVTYLGHLKRPGLAMPQGGVKERATRATTPSERDRDAMIPAGQYGMTYDASQLQVGDMIATSARGAISEAIRQYTSGPASHIALYIGDGMVVEAVQDGVVQNTLAHVLGQTHYAAAYRLPNLTAAEKRQIKAYALDAVARGVGYDFLAIASFQHRQSDDRLFCSELVFEAYASAGRPLGNAQQSQPSDVITISGIEYLGHLPAGARSQSYRGRAMSTSVIDNAIQAAVAKGASEQEARAYFSAPQGRARPMGGGNRLPDISFLDSDSLLFAGVETIAGSIWRSSINPLNHLFDFCTQHNLCIAIGVHGSIGGGAVVGGSAGVVVAPHRRAGVYISGNSGEGYMLEGGVGIELIVVWGGESNFNGTSFTFGGSLDFSEGPGVGARIISNTSGSPIGFIAELNASAGVPVLSVVEVTARISQTESFMTILSVRPMSGDSPQLQSAIRDAVAAGATEEEARAFFTTPQSVRDLSYTLGGGSALPEYKPLTGWRRTVVRGLVDAALPLVGASAAIEAFARRHNVSVGIGAGLSGGLGGAVSGGVGVVYLPNGDMAFYGTFSIGGGWNFELTATMDLTMIRGNASQFFGTNLVVGGSVSVDAGVSVGGGARLVMPEGGGEPVGLILEVGVGLGVPGLSTVEATLAESVTVPLSYSQSVMIGGLPARPGSAGLTAPPASNVVPFVDRAGNRQAAAAAHPPRERMSVWR